MARARPDASNRLNPVEDDVAPAIRSLTGHPGASVSLEAARRIVARVATSLAVQAIVTVPDGTVIANSVAASIGIHHRTAAEAVERGEVIENAGETADVFALPLTSDGVVLGALVLVGEAVATRAALPVVRLLAELIIHQVEVIERLAVPDYLVDRLVSSLVLRESNVPAERIERDAVLLQIDLMLPRVAVAVEVGPLVSQAFGHQHEARNQMVSRAGRYLGDGEQDVMGLVDGNWLVLLTVIDVEREREERALLERRTAALVQNLSHVAGCQAQA